jgi:hypothetical protein
MSTKQSILAANAISGERSTATVTFPITGDQELDAVSAILWALNDSKVSGEVAVRVLTYLVGRFRVKADHEKDSTAHWESLKGSVGPTIPFNPRPPFSTPTADDIDRLMARGQNASPPALP